MKILVLNSGSSTLKYQLFNVNGDNYEIICKGNAERIARDASFVGIKYADGTKKEISVELPDHNTALNEIFKLLLDGVIGSLGDIHAIGHRIVQGGAVFKASALIDDEVIRQIEELAVLAPLHNYAAALVIRAVKGELPDIPQVAVFDTAFHQTMPAEAYTYALPLEQRNKYKIRRYGAHGTSHKFVAERTTEIVGKNSKIITCHIGSGASITAVKDGICVDTSMGLTPLAGIIMDTRCGDIDPYIPLYIMKTQDLTPEQVNEMLNKKSGKYGLSGYSDSRDFEAAYLRGETAAIEGMKCYIYSIVKFIGSYIAAMGGVDAIVFTAGVGENSPLVRKLVLERLSYLGIEIDEEKNGVRGEEAEITKPGSKVRAFVIPTNEELAIAKDTVAIAA